MADEEKAPSRRAEHVKDIMTTGVVNVLPTDSVQTAAEVMTNKNISCVIVTEKESNKPVGIITERDLVRRVLKNGQNPKKIKADSVMTKGLVTVSEEASLEEAMRIIENMKIRRLPVVNEKGLVGLITQTDIVKETYSIHKWNRQLMFHQNLQSYIIIGMVLFVIVSFLIYFFFWM